LDTYNELPMLTDVRCVGDSEESHEEGAATEQCDINEYVNKVSLSASTSLLFV